MMPTTKDKLLQINDRCDKCGAQASVWVKGNSGELLFCRHDYNRIINDTIGYERMMSFTEEIIDERDYQELAWITQSKT